MESREGESHSPLDHLRDELAKVIEGQRGVVERLMVALVAGGHILIEGVPGVAKTLIARSLAAALGIEFSRIQFTPDLMPADITGVNVFDPKTAEFRFRAGPLFADIVLADEINRAPAKTQSALLEAMQEGQVTIDGTTHELSPVMTVIATQNPLEYEGTYPLPEAQLDRFMMKVVIDYPDADTERAMLERMHRLGAHVIHPEKVIRPVIDRSRIVALRERSHQVEADDAVIRYIVDMVRTSRSLPSLARGGSSRATVMLLRAAKAYALLRDRTYVTPDDVRELAPPVLRHRIELTPEAEIDGLTPDRCIDTLLAQVAVPR
jgi:MoxR-like ATPase